MHAHGIDTAGEALVLALVGFGIVFGVLSLTATMVWLVGRVDARWQQREALVEQQRVEREPTIDDTTMVIIAAAVVATLGARVRVRSVRRLISPDARTDTWSSHGRATLLGSHVITGRTGVPRRP